MKLCRLLMIFQNIFEIVRFIQVFTHRMNQNEEKITIPLTLITVINDIISLYAFRRYLNSILNKPNM